MGPKKRGQVKKTKQQSLPFLVGLEPTRRPEKEPEPDQHDTPTPPSDQDESPDDSDNTVTAAITHYPEKRRKKGDMPNMMIRLARQRIGQDSLCSGQ